MFRSVKKRLAAIYTVTTGIIVVMVTILLYQVFQNQVRLERQESFRNNVETVAESLKNDRSIRNTWMSMMEQQYQMLMYIEDNGQALVQHGSWKSEEEREKLIEKVKEKALLDGVDIRAKAVSYREIESEYYTVQASDGSRYYGIVMQMPFEDGYRSAILLQRYREDTKVKALEIIRYMLVDGVAVLAIYFVSRILIAYAVRPAEVARKKQTEFIAAASHELKSPLAVVRTSISGMERVPEQRKMFEMNIER
ncbi:MAG: hypothetical protein E7256_16975 [Lachnospiraceae bacterium]|nr:hypothetical protein [Lachnospiraceae bacterium]